jgi:peptidoglycan hydrolase CwlO-like protein
MDNVADPAARLEARNPLIKWVDEMQDVMRMITTLIEDNDRHRAVAESAQREQAEARDELGRLRAEMDRQRAELDRQRTELDRQRTAAESLQRERDELRAEIAALHSDNERLHTEQVEAGETAAKLLGEMKELVNQVAHKFQGPSKSSPFAREPRSPQP